MTSFSGVTFVLFCFVFRLYAFDEAAALRSIVLRYAGAPIATRVFFSFCLFGDVAFFRVFFVQFPLSLRMENTITVVRSFLPVGIFLPCDHGLDFRHQLM